MLSIDGTIGDAIHFSLGLRARLATEKSPARTFLRFLLPPRRTKLAKSPLVGDALIASGTNVLLEEPKPKR